MSDMSGASYWWLLGDTEAPLQVVVAWPLDVGCAFIQSVDALRLMLLVGSEGKVL